MLLVGSAHMYVWKKRITGIHFCHVCNNHAVCVTDLSPGLPTCRKNMAATALKWHRFIRKVCAQFIYLFALKA